VTEGDEGTTAGALSTAEVRQLVETAVNPFCMIDATGVILWAGASVEEVLGTSSADLVGRQILDFVAASSLDHAIESLAAADTYLDQRAGVPDWEGTGPIIALVRADGTTVHCSVAVATPIRTGLRGFVLQLRRADSAHALEDALVAMGRNRPLTEVLGEVASMLQGELPASDVAVFYHSRSTGRLEHAVGPAELVGLRDAATLAEPGIASALTEPGAIVDRSVHDLPTALRSAARAAGYRRLTLLAIEMADGSPSALLAVWSRQGHSIHVFTADQIHRCAALVALVIQWERGRRALEWAASHDVLTGLHNRSHFVSEVDRARRTPEPTAVLYLDLDDFKPVNDRHGHSVGDRALVEVAARLRGAVRPTDIVARLGGDEFAVLCRGLDELEVAEALAERLVADVAQPMLVDGYEVSVGLSVGIASLLDGDDADRALARADDALRKAKVEGKGRWMVA